MPHFNFHQLSISLSPKSMRSSLRARRLRKSSNASQTSSHIQYSSSSNISIASSTIYHRRHDSVESITSASTAASSALDNDEFLSKVGLTSPYYVPTHIVKPSPRKPVGLGIQMPKRQNTGSSLNSNFSTGFAMVDMCGFHLVDDEEESFNPDLVVLEPRPSAPRFCGFEETLAKRTRTPVTVIRI